jgi:hypothetical integral membrane protein (TIGR02206 family)
METALAPVVVPTFEPFSLPWLQTSGTAVLLAALMLIAVRFLRTEQRALYARSLGWLMLAWVVLPPLLTMIAGQFHARHNLPLHWCDLTGGIAGLALLNRRQLLYEVSLFWGLTGAGSALLTPQFTQGTDWYYLAEFFTSHCLLLAVPLFLSIYENMRPRAGSWLGALAWLNVLALPVAAFDLLTGANYMFLLRAPTADLPIYKVGWPYYLVGFEIACLVIFALIYLPFRFVRTEPLYVKSAAGRAPPLGGRA